MRTQFEGTAVNHAPRQISCRGALFLFVCLLTVSGCTKKAQKPAAETYPVRGVVKSLGDPLPVGAQIEFRPESAENLRDYTAIGTIDATGKFDLRIPFVDRVLTGAVEGSHTVRIMFPSNNSSNSKYPGGIVSISEKFTVEPRENEFTITIPKKQ
jgi:hypothetical protein